MNDSVAVSIQVFFVAFSALSVIGLTPFQRLDSHPVFLKLEIQKPSALVRKEAAVIVCST